VEVEVRKNVTDKFQIVSTDPISKTGKEIAGIKILYSQKYVIYFGLINSSRISEKHSAKVKDGSTISYKILGGRKELLLRDTFHEGSVSRVNDGSSLYMLIDYQKGMI